MTALKLIKPSDTASRTPLPRGLPPVCPADVSPAVQQIWNYTVTELSAMKVAHSADRDALLCYCEAVAAHRRASVLLAKTDVLIRGFNGAPRPNPALGVQQRSAALIRAFAQDFGLTPAARGRIEVRGMDDGADNLFAGIG
jgi:P27 family predicted phage terminase small subunit